MSAPTTRPVGPTRRASRRVRAPVPHPTSTATPPWRKPQRIDQLIDHGAVATFGALLEDGREAQVWAAEGDCAVVLGECGQHRLPLRGRQMEREEDYRWSATPCLVMDARYLALAGQTQFRKRGTAVGLREMCQQSGRDLVGAVGDCVGPVCADISAQDDRRRVRIGGQHDRRLSTQRPGVAMDDQWRRHQPPRPGELMQPGGRAGRGRDQRERRNRLRMGYSLGNPLHHVGTLDAKLAEQANHPISRRDTTLVHANPLAPHRRPSMVKHSGRSGLSISSTLLQPADSTDRAGFLRRANYRPTDAARP